MKTRLVFCLELGLMMMAASEGMCAGCFNGSFESWDLLGWNLHNDEGLRANEPFTRTAGIARTVAYWGDFLALDPQLGPVDGHRFLALNTRSAGNFLGNGTYNIFVSQSLNLNPGDSLSGWSAFFNGDSEPNDSAWARILDQNQNLVVNLWQQTSGTGGLGGMQPPPTPGWTQWQWSALTGGQYTLELGMTTSGANNSASYGFFDNITYTSVPEPTPILLGLLGGLMMVALRNRGR